MNGKLDSEFENYSTGYYSKIDYKMRFFDSSHFTVTIKLHLSLILNIVHRLNWLESYVIINKWTHCNKMPIIKWST